MTNIKIKSALISVYHKDRILEIAKSLIENHVTIYSTGGTLDFLAKNGIQATSVESLTGYPSILGGRVKTLHPTIFGGILARRDNMEDINHMAGHNIPEIDLVIVDLYPFEETLKTTKNESDLVEKIDIGGVSLIRATAKNFKFTTIVPSFEQYDDILEILETGKGSISLEQRKKLAAKAFAVTASYESSIANWMNDENNLPFFSFTTSKMDALRYGENSHQKGFFVGDLNETFTQISGKQLSYNNILDIDSAMKLMAEFEESTFAIIKHNNACGVASRENPIEAWEAALAGDPISAFGGILIYNREITTELAERIDKIFYEVLIAPEFSEEAKSILAKKGNRMILKINTMPKPKMEFRSVLNGALLQESNTILSKSDSLKCVTDMSPSSDKIEDLLFAEKLVKHTKSNAIIIAKNKQLIGSGTGQTSRVDALNQAIIKCRNFDFSPKDAVLASDAFFPFSDCVEIAHNEGIDTIIQPGGSIRDQESIDYCNKHKMMMLFSSIRHFKH